MGHFFLLILRQCRPQRSYRIFRFLVTVFLLFRRKQRWLLWRPLPPQELVDTIRTLGTSFVKLAQVLATRADFFDDDYPDGPAPAPRPDAADERRPSAAT